MRWIRSREGLVDGSGEGIKVEEVDQEKVKETD